MKLCATALSLQLLLQVARGASPSNYSCQQHSDCTSCTLGKCSYCPIDRQCQEVSASSEWCAKRHMVLQARDCPRQSSEHEFNSSLSQLAAVLSAASYARAPHTCLENFFGNGSLREYRRVNSYCSGHRCVAIIGRRPAEKLTFLAFKGSSGIPHVGKQMMSVLKEPAESLLGGRVHKYFQRTIDDMWPSVRCLLAEVVKEFPNDRLLVAGHSLGGALATLAAAKLATDAELSAVPLALYTLGQPRVGNYDFARSFDALVPNSWRVVYGNDIIAHVPPCWLIETKQPQSELELTRCQPQKNFSYHHGTEVFYARGSDMSPDSRQYRLCNGTPVNEDASCSNEAVARDACLDPLHPTRNCFTAHSVYHGLYISHWWSINQCTELTAAASAFGGSPVLLLLLLLLLHQTLS